jgi:hypothetical protein
LFCFNINSVSNLYNNSVVAKINGMAYIFTLLMFRKPNKTTINKNKTTNFYRSTSVDRGFETRLGQVKYYQICICCFSSKHSALRRKSKDWLARNQDNVSVWGDMSIHGLFQSASTIKIQLSVLVD